MNQAGIKSFSALALALVVFAAAEPSAAGDDCLKQGEFALSLAAKVRLDAASEAAAVRSLADIGVKPDDGWEPPVFLDEKAFSEIDRAVIVAFAEGKLAGGNPSAARAVLAGVNMPSACRSRYFVTSPAVTTPDKLVQPQPLNSVDVLKTEVPRQQITPGSKEAEVALPVEAEPEPGKRFPQPGKKPHPISPFEPWDGPTRPGPGAK